MRNAERARTHFPRNRTPIVVCLAVLLAVVPVHGALAQPAAAANAASWNAPNSHRHTSGTTPVPTATLAPLSTVPMAPSATSTAVPGDTASATATVTATAGSTATASPAASGTATPTTATPTTATPSATTPIATVTGTASVVNVSAMLSGLREMNYYPAANSWASMWSSWNSTTIDGDLGRIAALHANTVRVIIQAGTFGYPTPQATMMDHLAQLVSLAQNHGLRVQITLFDWWNAYTDVAGSKQWASAVVAPYAGDPRVAFFELQNEIDPTNGTALGWAQQMIPYLQSIARGTPVTVSVSTQYGIAGLRTIASTLQAAPPSFYDYHYYGAAESAYANLQAAMQAVAPASLFIGETGFSSALSNTSIGGLPTTTPALEAYQDYFYRAVANAARTLGLPQVSPWNLTDFIPGTLTWVAAGSPEYNFGLYRTDGSAKPVAASVSSAFGSGTVDTSFNNSFETCAGPAPALWRLFHGSEAQFACDTTVAHSGSASARISNSSGDSSGVPAFFLSPTGVHVVPGQKYSAGVWARGQNATGTTQIAIAWFDGSGNYLGTAASQALPTGTTSWTQLSATATAPAGAVFVQIHCKSAYNAGSAWFDDVTFG